MRFVYPEGKSKALTFSYDDGQIHDRKLVEIMNRHGMRGTFHLNSGKLAPDRNHAIFVAAEEVAELYAGHEVAAHGVQHRNLPTLTHNQVVNEILEDRRALEKLTGGMVQGLSYAFGNYSEEIIMILRSLGVKYSRTVNSTNGFFPPADFMAWHPTCHHNGRLMELGQNFLSVPGYVELPLMYVWGHSFEFAGNNDWNVIEEFAELMEGKEDIWYATNGEICDYILAVRSQEFSGDGLTIKNPTSTDIWLRKDGSQELMKVGPGQCVFLGER